MPLPKNQRYTRVFLATRYEIWSKLDNYEEGRVAVCGDLTQGNQLAQSLNDHWPADYDGLEVVADWSPESPISPARKPIASRPGYWKLLTEITPYSRLA